MKKGRQAGHRKGNENLKRKKMSGGKALKEGLKEESQRGKEKSIRRSCLEGRSE